MGSSLGGTFNYHSDNIHCPQCNKRGEIRWDGVQFVEVTGGFYERLTNQAPYSIELVCGDCGMVRGDISPPAISAAPNRPEHSQRSLRKYS